MDDWSAKIITGGIIDDGPDYSPQCGEKENKPNIEVASCGLIGGRWHNDL